MIQRFTRTAVLRIAAVCALMLCAFVTNAAPGVAAGGQRGMLTGTVVDATNVDIAQADVTISSPAGRYTAHTDSKGHFRFMGADSDTYVLTIHKDGYVPLTQPNIAVNGDQTTDLGTITLQKS